MKYQQVGDIAIITRPDKKAAAELLACGFRTVCYLEKISGELREPKVRKLAGNGTVAVHRENGILYKLDVAKAMFSKGNLLERGRLAKLVRPGEVVVDMFAGIGYFALPIAKAQPTARLYCIEKSPVAASYLEENVQANRIRNVAVLQSDCMEVKIPEKAGRVLMGYFPGTEKFLPKAIRFLGSEGWVHYHNIYPEGQVPAKPLAEVRAVAKSCGYRVVKAECRVVKSYAARKSHVVVDALLKRI